MSSFVLDSSAFLAYLQNEVGSPFVEAALLQKSSISIVNWAEVLTKVVDFGNDPIVLVRDLETQGLLSENLDIVPMTPIDALVIAQLLPQTKSVGLSLGDRACLALGLRLGLPILTSDRVWGSLSLGVEIRLIR